jgi:GNAT superfamily N-acetyltransferase
MPNVVIRAAEAGDCDALLAMIQVHACFERSEATISRETLLKLIENGQPVSMIVAALEARLAGYAALTFDYSLWRGRQWAHLDCLYVASEMRGLGIGAQLLRATASAAGDFGADRLEWQTPDWNKRAIAFYEREGATGQVKTRFSLGLCKLM